MHISVSRHPRIALGILGILGAVGLSIFRLHTNVEAAGGEGITDLPADITPLLSIAGTWQAVADANIDQNTPDSNAGDVVGPFAVNLRLPNGREGLAFNGWAYPTDGNTTSITPVNMAILEQQPDGTLQVATSKYVADPRTNGGSNALSADFNNDGVADIFLPAHNERPFLPASSTAYLSGPDGKFSKVTIGDKVEAHGATLADINGIPTVFTASYYVTPPPNGNADTATQYRSGRFEVIPDIGTGGHASSVVADFYGDGKYSLVCGDCQYGPGYPFPPSAPVIQLWNLASLTLSGNPFRVGTPYFDGKPQYAAIPTFQDPFKTHNFRLMVDDFNHDGMMDVLVEGMMWTQATGQVKNMLQMFQNDAAYKFTDVTDLLNTQYDENCSQFEGSPQIRDIDHSGVNSYLLSSYSRESHPLHAPGNYLLVNDGTGRLYVAFHDKLNAYELQIRNWLTANPALTASGYSVFGEGSGIRSAMRAYMTPNGLLNYVAIVRAPRKVKPTLTVVEYIFVNLPLQLDVAKQFRQPIVLTDRNHSRLIRTFAGDDTIYTANAADSTRIDGGLGLNTVVYTGQSQNYSASRNSDGSWTIRDNAGKDGADTLSRIQRLQFKDITVSLDSPTVVGPPSSVNISKGDSQSATVGAAYGTALQAVVRDFLGNPVPRVTVTFTVPASGASGAFLGGVTTATAVTDSSGVAAAPTFTANSVAGAIRVTVTAVGVSSPAVFNLTNTPRPGTITSVSMAGGGSEIVQNGWITIKGTNLVPTTTPANGVIWSTAPEFASGRMPTQLRGISVSINGQPAYIYYYCSAATGTSCASDQINALAPLDATLGPVQVVVSNSGVSTPAFAVNLRSASPAIPLVGTTNYVVATHTDNSLVGPVALSAPGYPFTPATSGETIVVYAFGLGLPTTPITGGASIQSGVLPVDPDVRIGSVRAQVTFAGLISPGLYQLNVVLPNSLASGDNSFSITYNGSSSPAADSISVQ